ncbi:YfbM family protein [Dyadobacter sp. CY356]|uniref:YfbM family protein n=1 Tax=Dyadobacter sp. CY356 TaxID=2906442 RepID=UPI001F43B33F|nr:YfbM family protein [Dyadobacter sp. CY356]MCF0059848.1 YfbM family protein [Dyadobacter sp. CY356]
MSMIGYYLRLTETELKDVLSDSSILEEKAFEQEGQANLIDIDKTWEAIFFVLTGHGLAEIDEVIAPLSWLLLSDHVVDENQDFGYGPAYYLKPSEVRQLNEELKKVSNDDFKNRFNGVEMDKAGIYPEIWQENESLEYVTENFELLKVFFDTAAANGYAMITFIS